MIGKFVLLACLLGLAVAGRGGGHRHHGGRGHSPQDLRFQRFLDNAKQCITTEVEKTDMAEDQRKALLDMIRPMHELQREHRSQCDGSTCEAHHTFTPPYKCSPEGELVEISPAEVYAKGLGKHIDATNSITEKDKAKKVVQDAMPCMGKMFTGAPDSAVPEEITGTLGVKP